METLCKKEHSAEKDENVSHNYFLDKLNPDLLKAHP
jgi:hypothetical protein